MKKIALENPTDLKSALQDQPKQKESLQDPYNENLRSDKTNLKNLSSDELLKSLNPKQTQQKDRMSLESDPWTISKWTQVTSWLLNRAIAQYKVLQSQAQNFAEESDEYKENLKQQNKKKEYFSYMKTLVEDLKKVQSDKKLGTDSILSLDDLNDYYKDKYQTDAKDVTTESRRRRDGQDGLGGGGGRGGEVSGRQREILKSKPFTSSSEILPITQLIYAFGLESQYPILAKGPDNLLLTDITSGNSARIKYSTESAGVNLYQYIAQLSTAIGQIKSIYSRENAGANLNAAELRRADHLIAGLDKATPHNYK